ncbi:MAG: SEC-C domain-containing protein [Alphaproteobacteria bacterium]|nr:SEC-C domain-containing protein [Alphaproteobacteria bacterium]
MNRALSLTNNGNCKIGRTDPCICGSGKKYKKCCLAANVIEEIQDDDLQTQQFAQQTITERVKSRHKDGECIVGTSEKMGFVSMSNTIIEFAGDFLHMDADYAAQRNILTFAITAWNLALISESEGKKVGSYLKNYPPLQEFKKQPLLKRGIIAMIFMFAEKKKKEYAHINRYIDDFEITELKNSDLHLNVASTIFPTSKKRK